MKDLTSVIIEISLRKELMQLYGKKLKCHYEIDVLMRYLYAS